MTTKQCNVGKNNKRIWDALGTLSKVDSELMSTLRYRCVKRAIASLSWCVRIVDDVDRLASKPSKASKKKTS